MLRIFLVITELRLMWKAFEMGKAPTRELSEVFIGVHHIHLCLALQLVADLI